MNDMRLSKILFTSLESLGVWVREESRWGLADLRRFLWGQLLCMSCCFLVPPECDGVHCGYPGGLLL